MERLHYSNATLVGNWYEDRLDAFKEANREHSAKYSETPIKMAHAVPNMYMSSSSEFHHRMICVPPKPQIALLSAHSNPLPSSSSSSPSILSSTSLLLATPSLPQGVPVTSGWNSVLPQHSAERSLRCLDSTMHTAYGGPYSANPQNNTITHHQHHHHHCSTTNTPDMPIAGKSNSAYVSSVVSCGLRTHGATGECLRINDTDPKLHTFVQRSWSTNRLHFDHYINNNINTTNDHNNNNNNNKNKNKNCCNIEGLSLNGLGERDGEPQPRRKKNNDTLRRDTGIWQRE